MNGAETYTLLLTTAPAEKRTENVPTPKNASLKANEVLTADEKKVLADIVKIGSLPDTLK
jgi:hypothetical protein